MSKSVKLFFKTFLKMTLWAGLILAGLVILYVIAVIAMASFEEIDVDAYVMNYSSQIYYVDKETGNAEELDKVYRSENRTWVSILDMPKHLKDAAVAIEDERFFKHPGFDVKRTVSAAFYYIVDRGRGHGGSTITQQLVKNLTGQDDRSVPRKIKEIWNSIRLERKLSKDQILELYLNTMYLSQGCNGVGAASHMYFNKDARDLSVAEAAAIVGITQYPTRYDPFLNPENNKSKQELVLNKMAELGYITQEECDKAKNEKLSLVKENMNTGNKFNSYFVDQVLKDVANDLVKEKGYDYENAMKFIHTGGIKIYSTIDPDIQLAMDNVYKNPSNFGNKGAQSAMVIIDPYTGELKAIAGGVGAKKGDFVLNRATMSPRQPGSSIKPLSVYAPAIEAGQITPSTVIADSKETYGSWTPVNYYTGFRGDMTVLQAVKLSTNTVAIKVLQKLGVDKSYQFMKNKLGITTLVDKRTENGKVFSDKNLPALALGGLTDGMTVYETAAAYATFVNDGLYVTPHSYTKVIDKNGKVLLEKKVESTIAMSQKTSQMMCQMLNAVTQAGGTGVAAALPNMATAGKTGTTDENKDRWFVGFTPYYVGAVWYGFDTPKDMSYLTNNPALLTWKRVMEQAHKGLPYKAFKGVSTKVDAVVCTVSGKLYSSTCVDEHQESTKEVRSYLYHELPKQICTPEDHQASQSPPPENTQIVPEETSEKPTESPETTTPPPPMITPIPSSTPSQTPAGVHTTKPQ